jgi:D-psicose/D-tagatose/L-ribulose 3-epimerase
MKFGVNMFIWSASFGPENFRLLPSIKKWGFDGIEIPLIQPAEMAVAEIRRALADNGLQCTFCAVVPGGLNTISDDAVVRARTLDHFRRSIEAGAEIGGRLLAGPLYAPVGYLPGRRRTADEWKWAVEAFQSLGNDLAEHAFTFALEPLNRFETYFLNTAEDAAALCREIAHPNVGVLFDTFHANIEEKSVPQAFRTVGPYLKHVHMSENDRGTPGTGHVDWAGVFAALRDVRYDEWLTIESFGFALGELSAAASIWRDLAPSAEAIAAEGVRFLKEAASAAMAARA